MLPVVCKATVLPPNPMMTTTVPLIPRVAQEVSLVFRGTGLNATLDAVKVVPTSGHHLFLHSMCRPPQSNLYMYFICKCICYVYACVCVCIHTYIFIFSIY
jgi:hypothetical protein